MKSRLFQRKTKRLVIRPLSILDYEVWKKAHLNRGPQKNKWDTLKREPKQLTRVRFQRLLTDLKKTKKTGEFLGYGIFHKETNDFMGSLSVMSIVRSITQSAFIGYSLLNNYWGQGYAEEAVNALIDIAFNDHKLHRVVAGIEPGNTKSTKLVKKIGFRKEGTAKRIVLLRGKWRSLVQFAFTTEDRKIKLSASLVNNAITYFKMTGVFIFMENVPD